MNYQSENIFRLQNEDEQAGLFLLDESIADKTAGLCDLLVSIVPGGIQLSLKERKKNRFMALETFNTIAGKEEQQWPALLEQVSSNSRLLRNCEFSKAIVSVFTNYYTLVPDALFHKGDEKSYLSFNFDIPNDLVYFSEHVQSFQLQNVFAIPNPLYREIHHLFEDPRLIHHSLPLLESARFRSRSGHERRVFIDFRTNGFDVVVTEGKKLILLNSFHCRTNEDFLYYILAMFEQLEMNPELVQIEATGALEEESDLYKLLSTYIRSVIFSVRPSAAEYSRPFKDLPDHTFYSLFSLSLCGS